jgi:hypothetical protein
VLETAPLPRFAESDRRREDMEFAAFNGNSVSAGLTAKRGIGGVKKILAVETVIYYAKVS